MKIKFNKENEKKNLHHKKNGNKPENSKYYIPILLFLATLFILILINRPALYMNDEFISVNQLHQINIGHQFLHNECKYGCYQNGTPSRYFELKDNILGYTIFLPALSLPILKIFSLFGDNFRIPIIFGWSLIPLIIIMIVGKGYPRYSKIFKIPSIYFGAIISICLMMINIYYYHPFPFSAADAPIESGSIIFTNAIIGAASAVMIFLTSQLIWKEQKIALFNAVSILCCSSYLFWSGTAKDHILMTFLLIMVTYFFIKSIVRKNRKYQYIAFFFIGLLAWSRPEMGFSILFGSILFLILECIITGRTLVDIKELIYNGTICLLSTIFGSIPLMVNNFITTNNPFIPIFYSTGYYIKNSVPLNNPSTNQIIHETVHLIQLPSLIKSYFFSNSISHTISSIFSIFFYPESGNMSIAAVTPLFLTGLFIFIGYIIWKKPFFEKSETLILLLICTFIIFVFIAYTKSLPGISKSGGIVPDMRYFLPIYFLGGIFGFFPLVKWNKEFIFQIIHKWQISFLIIFSTITTFLMAIILPKATYNEYTLIYSALTYSVALLFIISFFGAKLNYSSKKLTGILFLLMISLPLSWQILMNLFYSVGKLHGYPFWMPYLEYLIEKYLQYQII